MLSPVFLAFAAVILLICFRILNVHCVPQKPKVLGYDTNFKETFFKLIPLLSEM